jgi:nucleotide-binding universal stress UspA family protein
VGDPREGILKYTKESDADLLVIGTHGRRGIAHLVLGSVAEWLVRTAPLPVLTVSSRAATAQNK